jgi:hypothetical protein
MDPDVELSKTNRLLIVLLSDRAPTVDRTQAIYRAPTVDRDSTTSIDRFIKWTREVATREVATRDINIDLGISLCLPKCVTAPRNDIIKHTHFYRESISGISALIDYASRNALDRAANGFGDCARKQQIFRRFEHIVDARICMERNSDPDKENTSNPITTTTVGTYPSIDAFPLEEHLDVDEFFYFDSEYHTPNYRNTLVRVNLNNNDLYGLLYYRDPHVHTYKKRVPWREFMKLPGTFLDEDQLFSMFSRWFFLNQLTKEHGDTFIEDTYDQVVFVTESMFDDNGMSTELTQELATYLFSAMTEEESCDTDGDMIISAFGSDEVADTILCEQKTTSILRRDLWIPRQFDADVAVSATPNTNRTPRSHSLVVTSRTFATPYLRFFEECLVLHGNLYFMKMHTETIETDKQWDLNDVMELYLAELEAGRNGRAM